LDRKTPQKLLLLAGEPSPGGTVTRLSLDVTTEGTTRITIAVSGEIDLATAPQLDACLVSHPDTDITLDLSGVGFLGTAGLTSLVRGYNMLRAAGYSLRTTGEPDHVLAVIDVAGLTNALHGDDPAAS
jgi:anti-sigma B factor antagonist